MKFRKALEGFLVLLLFHLFHSVYSYTCSTPDAWLWNAGGETNSSSNQKDILGSNVRQGKKWPNGIVTYKLHPSLTQTDREHMIHELGHSLCLGHEHQRSDRDKYVDYRYCNSSDPNIPNNSNKIPGYKSKGIYDYNSQMHYECGWGSECYGGVPTDVYVEQCGPQITSGLSVLDVDTINELYNCQGCYRHRWIPINHFTEDDKKNLYNFGFDDPFEGPLYPCRARLRSEVVIGKFEFKYKVCHAGLYDKEYFLTEDFEILTIPGGLKNEDSEYALVRINNVNRTNIKAAVSAVFENAVEAGGLDEELKNGYVRGYVAYATITECPKKCKFSGPLENFDTIGKVYEREYTYTQWFPFCHKNAKKDGDKFDAYRKQIIRHIKHIKVEKPLESGSQITLLGQVTSDAKVFTVDLAAQRDLSSVMFHFDARFDWVSQKNTIALNSLISNDWIIAEEKRYVENFPFQRGSKFRLVIACEDTQFRVSVNDDYVVTYKYQLPLNSIRYLIIRGDVDVIEVNGMNVQGEDGLYRRSFKNLERFYDLNSQINFDGQSQNVPNIDPVSPKDLNELPSKNVLKASVISQNSTNLTDSDCSSTTGNIYFMFGAGFGVVILIAIVLGMLLCKVLDKKREYSDVPVIYTSK